MLLAFDKGIGKSLKFNKRRFIGSAVVVIRNG